ncbi:MAG: 16S rRNA (guanine(966)-N(2))-methyltransferase RsmD [Candidatus Omnitrophica bacterium]|nr:16S rRNA (guanine(966)-N(2))-methyltransferase RsmD [Candidatus Omnitrophota bacterium]MDD5574406.1 16S rRNA (guanine(966)-N(2))-methyltransferase RsmD [Candidatus Omnitrophota bacterium]
MRIIAGKFKGRLISFPKHIRPTQDKVRQAIFDTLGGAVHGASVLELFAGSGALGIESLSRGASSACFIDIDRRSTDVMARNFEALGLARDKGGKVRLYTNDAFRALRILEKKGEQFDLVFLDPPYHKGLAKKALKTLVSSGILPPRSFVIVEHAKTDDLGPVPGALVRVKETDYGDIKVSFFQFRARS